MEPRTPSGGYTASDVVLVPPPHGRRQWWVKRWPWVPATCADHSTRQLKPVAPSRKGDGDRKKKRTSYKRKSGFRLTGEERESEGQREERKAKKIPQQ